MKRTIFALLALILMAQAGNAAPFTGTFAEAKLKAGEIGKPILVDFFTEW